MVSVLGRRDISEHPVEVEEKYRIGNWKVDMTTGKAPTGRLFRWLTVH